MKWYLVAFSIFIALSVVNAVYQFYKMAEHDAICRGIKHPKLMGLLASGGQRGEGLTMYLLGRRQYPSTMSEDDKIKMKSRKAKCNISLVILAIGAICFIITLAVFGG